jgi:hypothetical protein
LLKNSPVASDAPETALPAFARPRRAFGHACGWLPCIHSPWTALARSDFFSNLLEPDRFAADFARAQQPAKPM